MAKTIYQNRGTNSSTLSKASSGGVDVYAGRVVLEALGFKNIEPWIDKAPLASIDGIRRVTVKPIDPNGADTTPDDDPNTESVILYVDSLYADGSDADVTALIKKLSKEFTMVVSLSKPARQSMTVSEKLREQNTEVVVFCSGEKIK